MQTFVLEEIKDVNIMYCGMFKTQSPEQYD